MHVIILVSTFSGTYLTAQLAVGHVELAEHVAWREGHLIQVTRIPRYRNRRRVRRRRRRVRRRRRGRRIRRGRRRRRGRRIRGWRIRGRRIRGWRIRGWRIRGRRRMFQSIDKKVGDLQFGHDRRIEREWKWKWWVLERLLMRMGCEGNEINRQNRRE